MKLLTPIRYNLISSRGDINTDLTNTTQKLNHKLHNLKKLTHNTTLQYNNEYVIPDNYPLLSNYENMKLFLPFETIVGGSIIVINQSINDIEIHSNKLVKYQKIFNYSMRSPTSNHNDILLITLKAGNSMVYIKTISDINETNAFKMYEFNGVLIHTISREELLRGTKVQR